MTNNGFDILYYAEGFVSILLVLLAVAIILYFIYYRIWLKHIREKVKQDERDS
ncbi:hypothetical protein [Clostridium tertium]|uniref:hypothetical protein n=1 Tax=Clostridium tertium TaxID=1559 RepID=UPI0023B2CF29|nr:hypothetical protein [Clostridium tertium]